MNHFTPEELQNILNLISIAPIKGSDATVVALLQQKIVGMIQMSQPAMTPATSTPPPSAPQGIALKRKP